MICPAGLIKGATAHVLPGMETIVAMNREQMLAFQDCYPDDYSHCFGCGRLNEKGHKIKSYWDGEESVCHVKPPSIYSGGKQDILYGGHPDLSDFYKELDQKIAYEKMHMRMQENNSKPDDVT